MSRLLTSDLLFKIERPGQYLGNEWGAAHKSFADSWVRLCLTFPDLYEVGMSNFGQKILYQLINQEPALMCDRTYAPGTDMEDLLAKRGLSLFGLESRQALMNFELIGFSLQYELAYTNVLNMLNLAGLHLTAGERQSIFPLVFAGGPAAMNPEPLSKFMDFFIIGDGEQAIIDVMNAVGSFKNDETNSASGTKQELLRRLADIDGIYVPALYEETPDSACVIPRFQGVTKRVLRRVSPLTDSNQPAGCLIPYLSVVQDRQVLEVRRGCDRGCRFCQPGYTYLPVRERSAGDIIRLSETAMQKSGYEEFSMLSLCVSDYTNLYETTRALNRLHAPRHTHMSFPSQRADRMTVDLAEELKAVRKSGMTLAPEAGSERLRRVINKGLSHEQIISAIESAYRSGWSSIKLYYMIGLPGETDEDLDGIIQTLREATDLCSRLRRESDPEKHMKGIEFTCTISNFVPKPFTPFQWYSQTLPAEFARKQKYLKDRLKQANLRNVQLNCTNPQISLLEAVIARGDRRTGELIYAAFQRGAKFDAWDEQFNPVIWHEAAESLGIDLEAAVSEERRPGSRQPWDIVNVGLSDAWLLSEWEKSQDLKPTSACTENNCHACGVCSSTSSTHVLDSPKAEAMKINPFVRELSRAKESAGLAIAGEKPSTLPDYQAATRIRIEFSKTGDFKFIAHLDLQRLLIRAARRAGLALSYTEGFSPSPKLSLALSLPLFAESTAELADIELHQDISPEDLKDRLNKQLPPEVQISRARQVEKLAPSLATLVGRASYKAILLSSIPEGERREIFTQPDRILSSEQLVVEQPLSLKASRKASRLGKTAAEQIKLKNIRPNIFSLTVSESEPVTVEFCISHGSREHVKPAEILKLIAPEKAWQITRTELQTDDGRGIFQTSV